MAKLFTPVKRFFWAQEGASLAEYGLLVGLIAVVAIGAVTALGVNVTAKIQAAANAL